MKNIFFKCIPIIICLMSIGISCTKDNDLNAEGQIEDTAQGIASVNNQISSSFILSDPDDISIVSSSSSGIVFNHDLSSDQPGLFIQSVVSPPPYQFFDKLLVYNNTNVSITVMVRSYTGSIGVLISIEAGGVKDINVENAFIEEHQFAGAIAYEYKIYAGSFSQPISGSVNTYMYYDYY